jgi:hypothetical protein
MHITRTRTLTPCGVARLFARGIQASYAPENQQMELERLVEYLQDLAVSRNNDAELPSATAPSIRRAQADAEWFDRLATELEVISSPSRNTNTN